MIDAFIFTRDRACQTDLLLRSCKKNAPGWFRFHVLWKASHEVFRRGYELCQSRHTDINWIEETGPLKEHFLDVIRLAGENRLDWLTLFTDDCVFYRPPPVTLNTLRMMLGISEDLLTFSFRLGENTIIQNYQTGELQHLLPEDTRVGYFNQWEYRHCPYTANYGYPFGMDGHAFRSTDLLAWTTPMEMPTFRAWEGALHLPENRDRQTRPLIACFRHSCVVNIPANSVQVDACRSGVYFPSHLLDLNQCWLDGLGIDLDSMDFSNIRSCHIELPWRFVTYGQCQLDLVGANGSSPPNTPLAE